MSITFLPRTAVRILSLFSLLIGTFGAVGAQVVHASGTITVNSLSDDAGTCAGSGVVCLRTAVATANGTSGATTISFSVSGTIVLGSVITITTTTANALTISNASQPPSSPITISGGNTTQIFDVANNAVATLDTLTLQNGHSAAGGAIEDDGTLTITNSLLTNNAATGSTGGAVNAIGALTMTNSSFSYNTAATNGGAIQAQGSLIALNCAFVTNTATADNGGAIYNNGGTASIIGSTFSGNTSSASNGGALYNYYGQTSITDSTFSGNSAPGAASGGAIFNTGNSPVLIANTTISNNTAGNSGGGIYTDYPTNMYLLSDIVAGNHTTGNSVPDIEGIVTSRGHNFIGDGTGSGLMNGQNNDQVGNNGTVLNAQLGTLTPNGGPTQTMPLLVTSPAIGQGDCSGLTTMPIAPALNFDQRGIPRKDPNGTRLGCDVGAYERPNTDSIGIYRHGTFFLRLHNSTGNSDLNFTFGSGGSQLPIVGDWAGNGFDTIGVYDTSSGTYFLRNSNTAGPADETFAFGNPGDTPLAGRWQINVPNSGVGVYRQGNGILYMKNTLATGYSDYSDVLGNPGDIGVAGDWTGKDYASPGIYRANETRFYLSNQVTNGIVYADISFVYGTQYDYPFVGDWVSQGHFGVGLFRKTNGYVYLRNTLTTGYSDNAFYYGQANDVPVAGHWQLLYPALPAKTTPAPSAASSTPVPTTQGASGGSVPGGNTIGG